MHTGLPDAADSADFVTLVLGGALGMMLMASANHLLMVFLAVEMASLPSYVLAGFLKGKGRSSEAALKYVVYGAAASGVMLYGITHMGMRDTMLWIFLGLVYVQSIVEEASADEPITRGR